MEPNPTAVQLDHCQVTTVDFDDNEQVILAMRRGVAEAMRSHKEKGQYVVAYKNGEIVIIEPEDIVVPEVAG